MEEIYNCLIHKHSLAFAIGTITLLLTIILVSRHYIGFVLSLLLLLAGLGATYGIEHQDVVQTYFSKFINVFSPKQTNKEGKIRPTESTEPTEPTDQTKKQKSPDSQLDSQQQSKTQNPDQNLRGQSERQRQRAQRFVNTHVPPEQ